MIAPRIDDIIIIALKSQDIGALFTSIISPNIQNTDENNRKTKHPHIRPQSKASEHLFFFADINHKTIYKEHWEDLRSFISTICVGHLLSLLQRHNGEPQCCLGASVKSTGAQVGVLFKPCLKRWKDKHTVQQGQCLDSGFLIKV